MSDPVIIGINGYGGAGKDATAEILVTQFGFKSFSFADPMRAMVEAINPIVSYGDAFETFIAGDGYPSIRAVDNPEPIRYLDALADVGYNEAKFKYPEVRRFLQRLGTEAGRKILGDDIWAEATMKRIKGIDRVVIPDMRFANEARVLTAFGGCTWRIERPDVGPANDHISEVELVQEGWVFDEVIENDGTLADLSIKVEDLIRKNFPAIL